jgi:hypothetical protein
MLIRSKEVIQSYILTSARYDFNAYEKRILYRLVEICQPLIVGQKLDKNFVINKDLWGNHEIRLPLVSFLANEEDHNHKRVKDALTRLRDKTIEYEDEKEWKLIGLIEMPKINKDDRYVEFKIQPEIYETILNFKKGFRKFELETAMRFKSIYAMRFYELLSEKTKPITYSVESLKIMFNLEHKYKLVGDFIRNVIKPAKKELDKESPFTFEWEPIKEGKKITSITFIPKYNEENRNEEILKRRERKGIKPTDFLDQSTVSYLIGNFMFTEQEIINNKDVIKFCENNSNIMKLFSSYSLRIKQRENTTKPIRKIQGFVIDQLKREVAKHKK